MNGRNQKLSWPCLSTSRQNVETHILWQDGVFVFQLKEEIAMGEVKNFLGPGQAGKTLQNKSSGALGSLKRTLHWRQWQIFMIKGN